MARMSPWCSVLPPTLWSIFHSSRAVNDSGADIWRPQSSKHGIPGLLNGYYEENGPPLEDADIMLTSLPVDMLEEYHIEATKAIAVKDKEMLDGLTKVGFKLNPYPGGLFIKYFRDGGG